MRTVRSWGWPPPGQSSLSLRPQLLPLHSNHICPADLTGPEKHQSLPGCLASFTCSPLPTPAFSDWPTKKSSSPAKAAKQCLSGAFLLKSPHRGLCRTPGALPHFPPPGRASLDPSLIRILMVFTPQTLLGLLLWPWDLFSQS